MKFIYTAMLTCLAASASAQTETGNFMVGSNILTTSVNFQKDNTGFDIALQPKVGYFISDNIALGVALELGLNAVKSNLTMNYGVTPFTRVFIGNSAITEVPKRVLFYIEVGGGYGGRNSRYKDLEGNKTNVTSNGGVFYAGPGIDVFLSKNVAFEMGAEYRYIGGEPRVNRIGLNVGFQIFLSRAEGRAMAHGPAQPKE